MKSRSYVEITVLDILKLMKRKIWIIMTAMIVFFVIGFVYAYVNLPIENENVDNLKNGKDDFPEFFDEYTGELITQNTYVATTSILLYDVFEFEYLTYPDSEDYSEILNNSNMLNAIEMGKIITSYFNATIKNELMLSEIIKRAGLELDVSEINNHIIVEYDEHPGIITVGFHYNNAESARLLTIALIDIISSEEFSSQIKDDINLENYKIHGGISTYHNLNTEWVERYEQYKLQTGNGQQGISIVRYSLSGMFLGLIVSTFAVLIQFVLRKPISSICEVERVLGAPVLVFMKTNKNRKFFDKMKFFIGKRNTNKYMNDYNKLTIIFHSICEKHNIKSVIFTFASELNNKSEIIVNVAKSLASCGIKTLLVDSNINELCLNKCFAQENENGLTDILNSDNFGDLAKSTDLQNLDIITYGDYIENSTALFMLKSFEDFLSLYREKYECIIMDSYNVLESTDSLALAKNADGVVVVSEYFVTKTRYLAEIKSILSKVQTNILGSVIVNK